MGVAIIIRSHPASRVPFINALDMLCPSFFSVSIVLPLTKPGRVPSAGPPHFPHKCERIHLNQYPTRSVAQSDVFAYLEAFYNTIRPHSALGWISPSRFEAELCNSVA